MENESLKKRTAQLERDLRNAQLQIEVSTPAKGFDRTDSRVGGVIIALSN